MTSDDYRGWTKATLRKELRIWEVATQEISDVLDEAMEEEDVSEWEDLSPEWDDSIEDFFEGVQRINELRALLRR